MQVLLWSNEFTESAFQRRCTHTCPPGPPQCWLQHLWFMESVLHMHSLVVYTCWKWWSTMGVKSSLSDAQIWTYIYNDVMKSWRRFVRKLNQFSYQNHPILAPTNPLCNDGISTQPHFHVSGEPFPSTIPPSLLLQMYALRVYSYFLTRSGMYVCTCVEYSIWNRV